MRILSGIIVAGTIVGCMATTAPAQSPPASPPAAPAPADAAPLTTDSTVDQILDALDARGRDLKSFSADVTLTEGDASLGNETTRKGKVVYETRDGKQGGPRLRVTFDTREVGTRKYDEKIEYLLQDGFLTDRTYAKNIQVKRQVLRPGERVDLLKLGEGPFPLPIGQKKESVYAQFEVTKPAAAKTDPAGTVHVQLAPKPGTQFARKFEVIDVWVDLKTNMPARIETAQGDNVRSTDLTNFKVNPEPPLTDKDFALPAIDESKWDMHEEQFKDE